MFFDTGKATIQERSFKLLDDVASLLEANEAVGPIAIEGTPTTAGPPSTTGRSRTSAPTP